MRLPGLAVLAFACLLAPAASGFAPDSLLVASDFVLLELSPEGELLQEIPIPCPEDPEPLCDRVRDLAFDREGRLHVYYGTFRPFLMTFDPESGSWTQRTHPGWSTLNNTGYGGIVALGPWVFVTDQNAGGTTQGILRFDLETGEAVRFGQTYPRPIGNSVVPTRYQDLALGPDGLLYALNEDYRQSADVYDPETLEPLAHLPLDLYGEGRSLSVAQDGTLRVLGRHREVFLYDADGAFRETVSTPYLDQVDLDMDLDGSLVWASNWDDEIVLADADLAGFEAVPTGRFSLHLFVTPTPRRVDVVVQPRHPHRRLPVPGGGLVQVTVLGAPGFSVARVDVDSLRLGPDGAAPSAHPAPRVRDVDGDGIPDLRVRFPRREAGLDAADPEVCLRGSTWYGLSLRGCDRLDVPDPGCGPGGGLAAGLLPALLLLRTTVGGAFGVPGARSRRGPGARRSKATGKRQGVAHGDPAVLAQDGTPDATAQSILALFEG